MLVSVLFSGKQSLRQRFLCKCLTEVRDFRERWWGAGEWGRHEYIRNLATAVRWTQNDLRSHMKTFRRWEGEREKHFSIGSQPSLVRGFPQGLTPATLLGCFCIGVCGFSLGPSDGANWEVPGWVARTTGHTKSGCSSKKMARVYLELVMSAVPTPRDRWSQEDLKRHRIQSLWCTWNFTFAFPSEHDIFNID